MSIFKRQIPHEVGQSQDQALIQTSLNTRQDERGELQDAEIIGSLRADISSQLSYHQTYLHTNMVCIEESISEGTNLMSQQQQVVIEDDRKRVNKGLDVVNQISGKLDECFIVRGLGILAVETSEIPRKYYPKIDYTIRVKNPGIYY